VPEAESRTPRKPVNVRRGLLVSLAICVVAGILMLPGLVSLALVIGSFGVLLNIVGTVLGILTLNGGALKLHGARIAIYLCLLMLGTALVSGRADRGKQIAANVIAALGNYQRDHADYPGELEALVPKYLPNIPLAVDTPLEAFPFRYYRRKDTFSLNFNGSYLNVNYYESDSGRWGRGD